jgi:alpha-beta hydrolase superfamily lysophospholipase
MGLVADEDGAVGGYEPVHVRPELAMAPQLAGALVHRPSAQPSRRGVLFLRGARDGDAPPDLARWYTERGFHFYVAAIRPPAPRGPRPRRGAALAAVFRELDARCEHLRNSDGIDNVLVIAHGQGALAAAAWCAEQRPAGRADALILYTPSFGRGIRHGLDIPCPVLVIGGPDHGTGRAGRRSQPATASHLGRHVTWLRPTDGEARPDAADPADRSTFFDEMGRWLGAYMYGPVRDQLL